MARGSFQVVAQRPFCDERRRFFLTGFPSRNSPELWPQLDSPPGGAVDAQGVRSLNLNVSRYPARRSRRRSSARASKNTVLYRNMTTIESFEGLSDTNLLSETERIAAATRSSTAELIAALAELDKRRLYLGLGYSSLFVYCTSRLHLTEGEAFNRIEVARAVRRFPALLHHLVAGSLTLTAVRLLAPHLTPDNCDRVVKSAEFQGTRAIEKLVAHLRPQPPVPSVVRKLPGPAVAAEEAAPTLLVVADTAAEPRAQVSAVAVPIPDSHRPVVKPLSAAHYKVQITFSAEAHEKLRRAQALLRHQIPGGDPAQVLERGLDALLERLLKQKAADTDRPRKACRPSAPVSRHIPASVKREVWKRDDARCVFEAPDGRRCSETSFLEYHHVVPYARGGKATVENIELRCRAHNLFDAEREFGVFVRETRHNFEAPRACHAVSGIVGPQGATRLGTGGLWKLWDDARFLIEANTDFGHRSEERILGQGRRI